MVSFGEKAKIKKAGNLNLGRSYIITTVSANLNIFFGSSHLIFFTNFTKVQLFGFSG